MRARMRAVYVHGRRLLRMSGIDLFLFFRTRSDDVHMRTTVTIVPVLRRKGFQRSSP
jgi:hypothetical protein